MINDSSGGWTETKKLEAKLTVNNWIDYPNISYYKQKISLSGTFPFDNV